METLETALQLWREGTDRLLAGDLEEAVALFTRSLELSPTAEAYTFRGWAYSFTGRLDEAIEECRKAIATDPGFGTPTTILAAIWWSWASPTKRSPGSSRPNGRP